MLDLNNLKVQLQPAGDCPGVLQGCTGLKTLSVQRCLVKDPQAAFAAIAALPELDTLCIYGDELLEEADGGCLFMNE